LCFMLWIFGPRVLESWSLETLCSANLCTVDNCNCLITCQIHTHPAVRLLRRPIDSYTGHPASKSLPGIFNGINIGMNKNAAGIGSTNACHTSMRL